MSVFGDICASRIERIRLDPLWDESISGESIRCMSFACQTRICDTFCVARSTATVVCSFSLGVAGIGEIDNHLESSTFAHEFSSAYTWQIGDNDNHTSHKSIQ